MCFYNLGKTDVIARGLKSFNLKLFLSFWIAMSFVSLRFSGQIPSSMDSFITLLSGSAISHLTSVS